MPCFANYSTDFFSNLLSSTVLSRDGGSSASLTALAPNRSKIAFTFRSMLLSWQSFDAVRKSLPFARWSEEGGFLDGYGGFATHFSKSDIQMYRFYRDHISGRVSLHDGLLYLRYSAYSSVAAKEILKTSIESARQAFSRFAMERLQEQLTASIKGLDIADHHLRSVNAILFQVENKIHIHNPKQKVISNLDVEAHLQEQLSQMEAKRSALLKLSPNNPSLAAIEAAEERLLMKINKVIIESNNLSIRSQPISILLTKQRAAERAVNTAQLVYQKIATEAASKPYTIVAVDPITSPRAPSGPNRWLYFGVLLLVSFLLWGFLR